MSDLESRVAAASARIDAQLDDASAHARNALTERARGATEGRPTQATLRRSRSYAAALARLAELQAALVTAVEAARVDDYRDRYRHWGEWTLQHAPESARPRLDPASPPQALIDRCRVAVLHGRTLAQEFKGVIDPIGRRLLPALTLASIKATPRRDAVDALGLWRDQSAAALLRTAALCLNDALVLADRLAGRDVIDPERLHPDPTLPE